MLALLLILFIGLPVGSKVTVSFPGTPIRSGPSSRGTTIRGEQNTGVMGRVTKACVPDNNPDERAQSLQVFCYVDFQTGADGWVPAERLLRVK